MICTQAGGQYAALQPHRPHQTFGMIFIRAAQQDAVIFGVFVGICRTHHGWRRQAVKQCKCVAITTKEAQTVASGGPQKDSQMHSNDVLSTIPKVNSTFREFAASLRAVGYSPLPVLPGTKRPALRSWSDYCDVPMTAERITDHGERRQLAGLGVARGYGRVIALDVDTRRACADNGLLKEDGRLAVLATLGRGPARAEDAPLPILKDRARGAA